MNYTLLQRSSTPVRWLLGSLWLLLLPLVGLGQSTTVVISQVYGGGGSTSTSPTPSYNRDYVELFNKSSIAQPIGGFTVQYMAAGSSGSFTAAAAIPAGTTIPAGGHYLIGLGTMAGATGMSISADYTPSTTLAMNAIAGKVALVNGTTTLTGANPATDATVIDFVGYGNAATGFEGAAPTPNLSTTAAALRAGNGCTDTNQNSSDFAVGTPNPRNLASSVAPCGTPSLTVSPGALAGFSTTVGTASASQSYVLTSSYLTADVTVTAPMGYEVSLTNNTGSYGSSVTAPAASVSTTAGQTIYVRLSGSSASSFSGNVTNVSGSTSASVAVSGTTTGLVASPAGLLALEENIDYAGGTALASTTAGWQQNGSDATNAITTATGNLSNINHQYPQGVLAAAPAGVSSEVLLATSGQDVYKLFTQPTGATAVYMAALVTVNSAQAGGDYFLHFISGATATSAATFRSLLYARAVAGSSTTFNFALTVAGESAAATYNTTAYTIGTTYLVVLKYENSAATSNVDAASLFVLNPTTVPVIEPTPLIGPLVASNNTNQTALNAIALRQGDAATAPTATVDAIRVASGWGAAVGRLVYTSATSSVVAGDYYSLRVTGTGTVATVSGTGPGNGLTAATSVNLEKQLDLDGGQVATSATNVLLLRARNVIGDNFEIRTNSGASSSYVDGPVSRETVGSPSVLFPVGRNGNYRPMTLSINQAPSGTTIYTGVQTEASAYTADATVNAPLTRVSRVRYFSITPSPVPAAGAFTGTITLSFGSDDQVTDPSVGTFVVAKSDGAGWNNLSRSNNATTTLTSATFQDFSNFALASTDPDVTVNPLPVQLTRFTAARAAAGVQVAWATASEKNSDHFEVERSLDGRAFASVARVAAHGTTAQAHSYTSLDGTAPAALLYYRLRQVDLDGTVAYSPVVTVAATDGALAEFTLAPNPARERLSFLTAQPTAYTVRNTLGQLVRGGTTAAGTNDLVVSELPAGVYFFELQGDAGRVVRKFVKE